jgi:hypothetical protein
MQNGLLQRVPGPFGKAPQALRRSAKANLTVLHNPKPNAYSKGRGASNIRSHKFSVSRSSDRLVRPDFTYRLSMADPE